MGDQMIIEIRHYTLFPGQREAFIEAFEGPNRRGLREAGMLVFGPMRDLEHPDKVHWMRAFTNEEMRQQVKDTFYESPVWHRDIAPLVMPLIAHMEADVVETTGGCETFSGAAGLLS